MPFSTQREARQFLACKIVAEAARAGTPLSENDQRVLFFSEQEPETLQGLSEDALTDIDVEYENKITNLLRAAYAREKSIPEEGQRYKDAYSKLQEGDHYISVMAQPVLGGSTARDRLIYIAIGLGIVGAVTAFAFWSHSQ
jgi:hypothetical protein